MREEAVSSIFIKNPEAFERGLGNIKIIRQLDEEQFLKYSKDRSYTFGLADFFDKLISK